jgi:hypothetical protein
VQQTLAIFSVAESQTPVLVMALLYAVGNVLRPRADHRRQHLLPDDPLIQIKASHRQQ